MEWLLVLLLVLTLVTVIGHGIWVLVARLLGGAKPPSGSSSLQAGFTGARPPPLPRAGGVPAAPRHELLSAREEVTRLLRERRIGFNAYALLTSAIDAEVQRLPQPNVASAVEAPAPPMAATPIPVLPVAPPLPATPQAEPFYAARAVAAPPSAPAAPQPPFLPRATPVAPPVPRAPRTPRRPWSEVLAAFMEQKNIRWGELVGGLLIVGCSLALVLSFWSEISQRPVLKFSVFTAVTGAMFALGLYTEHRWKLPHTSRGLLLIGTLLVPLNFLAFAALSRGQQATLGRALAGQAAAFALFACLVRAAAKVIAPRWPNLLAAGVMSLSLSSLAVRYAWPDPGPLPSVRLFALAAAPLACYLAAAGVMLVRARRWEEFTEDAGQAVLTLLGVLTFAAVFPLGLIVFRTNDPAGAVRHLAPLVNLAGIPLLAAGLLLWRRVTDLAAARLRTAGTAVAVAGVGVMLAGVALSWPDPARLLPVAAVNFAVLTWLAVRLRVPAAHWLAAPCLLLAYLVCFHAATGRLAWQGDGRELVQALLHPAGAAALVALVALMAGAAELLHRLRRRDDARAYAWSATAVAGLSLLLVTLGTPFLGRGTDAYGSTWVYLAYAILAFAAAWRTRTATATWAGWALLLAACGRGLSAYTSLHDPWTAALLALAAVAAASAVRARRLPDLWRSLLRNPAWWTALASSAAAGVLVAAGLSVPGAGAASLKYFWLAGIWLVLATDEESPLLFNASQAATALAAALAGTAWAAGQLGFADGGHGLLDTRTVQAQAVALSVLCTAWLVIPPLVKRVSPAAARLGAAQWTFTRALAVALVVGLLAMAVYAVAPSLAAEFGGAAGAPAVASATGFAGPGAWLVLALVLVLAGLSLWDRPDALRLQMLLAVTWAACPLLAARGGPAAASPIRWLCAVYFAAGFAALWARGTVRAAFAKMARRGNAVVPAGCSFHARAILIVLGAAPVLALSVFAAGRVAAEGVPLSGASAGFRVSLGYALPLLLVTAALVAEAVRTRSSTFAVAAALSLSVAVSTGFIFWAVTPPHALDGGDVLKLVQLNAAALSTFALAWSGATALAARRHPAPASQLQPPRALRALALSGLGINVVLVALGAGAMFLMPAWAGLTATEIGSLLGWAALLLSAAAAASLLAAWRAHAPLGMAAAVVAATAAMAALTVAPSRPRTWLGYHVWIAAHSAAAWGVLALGWWLARRRAGWAEAVPAPATAVSPQPAASPFALEYQRAESENDPRPLPVAPSTVYVGGEDVRRSASRWAAGLGLLSVALALRAVPGDPQSPWWSVGAVLLVSLLTTAIACWRMTPRFLYASALLLNLAATIFAIDSPWKTGTHPLLTLLEINVIALAAPAVAWLVLELHVFRRAREAEGGGLPPVHRVAAVVSAGAMAIVAVVGVASDLALAPLRTSPMLGWMALGSTVALMLACLWDRRARFVPAGLYLLGLVGLAMIVDRFDLPPERIKWFGGLLLSAYTLLTSALWRWRGVLRKAADEVVAPLPREQSSTARWLVPANLCLAGCVVALAFWSGFTFADPSMRLVAAVAAVTQAASVGLLAHGDRGTRLRQVAIGLAAAGAVAFGWAWMTPGPGDSLTHRAAVVIAVLCATFAACTLGLRRLLGAEHAWSTAGSKLAPAVAFAGLTAMLLTIGMESAHRVTHGRVPMHPVAIGAIIAAFAAAAIVSLLIALDPRRDPLRLSERGRQGYVYAAEALAALLYLHVKLTCPPILPSLFYRFWPLILMAWAFAGVGAGEVFRRRNLRVLYEPFERTGAFLPLMLVTAFWFVPSEARFQGVLLAAGAVYAAAAVMRRSFTFALLAALAGNGALWYVLHHTDRLGLLSHPQLWVIPAALSVLAATELNKDRLGPPQVRSLRYLTLIAIYVSSTADVFLNSASLWLPLVLAALSVAGVLVGVMYRIRPFLFLGTAFLALAVGAMIWNASVNLGWTWLWYVAGIVLGLMILALFALFEKKRAEMVALMQGLKAWQ